MNEGEKHCVKITWGQTALWSASYEFDTAKELDAFLYGLAESDGFLGYEITNRRHVVSRWIHEQDQIEVGVNQIDAGFSVTVKDLDSGTVLPSIRIFDDKADAIAHGKKLFEAMSAG